MKLRHLRSGGTVSDERGQVLIIFVVMISVIFLAAAVAIDYGHWLSERRGLARASDLGALAAAQDLPEDASLGPKTSRADCVDMASCHAAFTWAERNGYGEINGATVTVEYYCANEIPDPPENICFNPPDEQDENGRSECPSHPGERGCDGIRVIVEKDAVGLFSLLFGGAVKSDGSQIEIGGAARGSVDFDAVPIDLAITLDASESMGAGCNGGQSNPGCPINEARIAALNFATTLLGDEPAEALSQVGYAPYHRCHGGSGCVTSFPLEPQISASSCNNPGSSRVLCLDRNLSRLENRINGTQPAGSSNICTGMHAARRIIEGPTAQDDVARYVVILTDGANTFETNPSIPNHCWPESNPGNPGTPGPKCGDDVNPTAPDVQRTDFPPDAAGQQAYDELRQAVLDERHLDRCTWDIAEILKDDEVEVFVVGLKVEDGPSPPLTPGFCGQIGDDDPDSIADRRLLRCMATSDEHYYETDNAADLDGIFQAIAYEVAGSRLAE